LVDFFFLEKTWNTRGRLKTKTRRSRWTRTRGIQGVRKKKRNIAKWWF